MGHGTSTKLNIKLYTVKNIDRIWLRKVMKRIKNISLLMPYQLYSYQQGGPCYVFVLSCQFF